jgi:phosphotransferase system  glucose/maltose/N-acetylglucosamine-specific IIC component
MEDKTHKLLRGMAWLMVASGLLVAIHAIFGMRDFAGEYEPYTFPTFTAGVIGGAVFSSVFFFFAKLVEQNDERYKQQSDLHRLLNKIDDKLKEGR